MNDPVAFTVKSRVLDSCAWFMPFLVSLIDMRKRLLETASTAESAHLGPYWVHGID